PAAPAMDEDDLVGRGVAKQLVLRLRRPATRQDHVGVGEDRDAARDRVAARGHLAGLGVNMSKRQVGEDVDANGPRGFDALDPRRRLDVVDDAVRPAEPLGRDDFFVIDPFALVPGAGAVHRVPLGRDLAEASIVWHGIALVLFNAAGGQRYFGASRSVPPSAPPRPPPSPSPPPPPPSIPGYPRCRPSPTRGRPRVAARYRGWRGRGFVATSNTWCPRCRGNRPSR